MINFNRFFYVCLLLCAFTFSNILLAQETRLPITVANNSGSVLTNYTVRVELNASNAPGFDFANNGDDIMVWNSDASARLDFYVESVDDTSDIAVIWVKLPTVPVSPPDTEFLLDYNVAGVTPPLSDGSSTFVEPGYKFHSQPYDDADPGPESFSEGEAEFDFETVLPPGSGHGCDEIDGLQTDNNDEFGSGVDFGLFIETFFEVTTPALYEFRLGSDFGHGGELYLDDVTLEEGWTDDIWWGNNFNNADVLQGSRFLGAGFHTLKVLGFERCCDGDIRMQYRIDTDGDGDLSDETFEELDANSTGITILAPSCPVATPTISGVTTVPVTLSKFTSFKAGPFVKVEWQTADETFNAGFDLWTLEDSDDNNEQTLQALNNRLIRSNHFDSLETQYYKEQLHLDETIDNLVISSMDINGKQEFFGPFDIGETYGDDYQSQVIDWVNIHERFKQSMQEQGYVRVHNRWRRAARFSNNNESERVQIAIEKDGMHRITYESLLNLGLDWKGVKVGDIALTQDENSIPRRIKRSTDSAYKGRFGPGAYIDFVGVSPQGEAALYSEQSYYQVVLDRTKAVSARVNRRQAQAPQNWLMKSSELHDNNRHSIISPIDTPWFIDIIYRTQQVAEREYTISINADDLLVQAQNSRLDLNLAGVTDLPAADNDDDGFVDPDHVFSVSVNDQLLDTIQFEGQLGKQVSIEFPTSLLTTGDNKIKIQVLESGYFFDAIAVDSIKLSYPIESKLQTQSQQFDVELNAFDGLLFETDNRQGLLAYQYRLDHNLMRLKIRREKSNVFTVPFPAVNAEFSDEITNQLFIGHELYSPVSLELMSVKPQIQFNDANLLIISHPSFVGEVLDNYVLKRRQQGVEAIVFNSDDIHQIYGPDVAVHEAIKRFLKDADHKVQFDSVLLVGGHSYDYNNYISDDNISFIPAFYRPIGIARHTPTDLPFVDFDDDGYPDKKIGRWPVRTLENVVTITQKSILWADDHEARKTTGHKVLMLSDVSRDLPFKDDVEEQLIGLQSTNVHLQNVDKLYLDELLNDPNIDSSEINTIAQEQAKQGLEEATWAFYSGHGSPVNWSASSLISSQSVQSLGNINSPILITSIGCYTTYYESPSHNSLAHQLLFADEIENNGAVAIHGPALVGGYENQKVLANLIIKESQQEGSIGDAIKDGMRALPLNYTNAILNWALLGDPTLPIQ